MSETYLFMSNPQPVTKKRAKYRDPDTLQEEIAATANLMWDARVHRGPISGKPIQLGTGLNEEPFKLTSKQIASQNKERKDRLIRNGVIRPTFPSVAEIHASIKVPKKRVEVPLHLYLQEQVEPTLTHTLSSQTDAFVQEEYELKPPVFVPRKIGKDVFTQVENDMVFQYDIDVLPVLETVISKTLEQSLMEVRQEQEMDFMRQRMELMMKNRSAQNNVMKRREAEEKELENTKNTLLELNRVRRLAESQAQRKIASRNFAKEFIRHLDHSVYDALNKRNYFEETVQQSVRIFMPWLYEVVERKISCQHVASASVQDVLMSSLQALDSRRQAAEQKRLAERLEKDREVAELADDRELVKLRRARIELYVHCGELRKSPIGPINITGNHTVGDVMRLVTEWVLENITEDKPSADNFRFLYDGKLLADKNIVLYELGLDRLHLMKLVIEGRPPVAPELQTKSEEGSKDDGEVDEES